MQPSLWQKMRVEFSDALRLKLAVKTAAACLIVMAAARALHLPQGYWAVISSFIIVQLSMADTLRKGILRTMGTLAGCLFGLLLALLFPDRIYLSAVTIFAWCVGLFYVSRRGRYSYALVLAAITPFMVVMADTAGLQRAATVAADRFLTITLGVLVSWFVIAVLWPVKEDKELLGACGRLIKQGLSFGFETLKDPRSGRPPTDETLLRRNARRMEYFLGKTDLSGLPPEIPGQIRSLEIAMRSLLSQTLHLKKGFRDAGPDPAQEKWIHETRFLREVAAFLHKLARVADGGVIAYFAAHRDEIGRICAGSEQERNFLYLSLGSADEDKFHRLARIHFMFYFAETLLETADISNRDEKTEAAPGKERAGPDSPPPRKRGLDWDAARTALKISIAVLVAAVAWAIPFNNIQAVISATLIANQAQQTASYRRGLFRILGTALGAAAGMALGIFFGHSQPAEAVMAAGIILLLSYIGLGEEDWHYTGLTAGVCFILVMGSISSEHLVAAAALGRMEGVFLGGLTAAIVVKFLFPFDHQRQIARLESRFLALFRTSLDALRRKISGDSAATDEITTLRWEMRAASFEYENIAREIVWDKLRYFRRRRYFSGRSQLYRDIYRCFFALFSLSRHIPAGNGEISIQPRIGGILSGMSDALGNAGREAGGAGIIIPDSVRDRVDDTMRVLNAAEEKAAAGGGAAGDSKSFFCNRVFLYQLRVLIENLSQLPEREA